MSTLTNGKETLVLPAGQVLSIASPSGSSGLAVRLSRVPGGGDAQSVTAIAGSNLTFGAYAATERFEITCDAGTLTLTMAETTFINMEGLTLPANLNAIRGANVNPARVSGWTAFSGTISDTPSQCYTDYRELHTNDSSQILGFGVFPFADSGASINTMMAYQGIISLASGSTLLTRDGNAVAGAHPGWFKVVMDDGSTRDTGSRIAPVWSDLQLNGTGGAGSSTEETFNFLASTGSKARSLIRMEGTSAGWVNLFEIDGDYEPIVTWEPSITPQTDAPTKGLRIKVGSDVYNIPAYVVS